MAIYAPGIRKGRYVQSLKREVVALLQLTAMVDMFTVLVVFLLQNYAVTNQILPISEEIQLPKAQEVKSLKPSYVVVLSDGIVTLNQKVLGSLNDKTSEVDWVFAPLKESMEKLLQQAQQGGSSFLLAQLKRLSDPEDKDVIGQAPFRVTIQADENSSYGEIKKIMYTLTSAGVKEMNFGVIKDTTDLE